MDLAPRLDLRSLLTRAEAAAPVGVVDAMAAAMAEMLGARGVSFLIADFSGPATSLCFDWHGGPQGDRISHAGAEHRVQRPVH